LAKILKITKKSRFWDPDPAGRGGFTSTPRGGALYPVFAGGWDSGLREASPGPPREGPRNPGLPGPAEAQGPGARG